MFRKLEIFVFLICLLGLNRTSFAQTKVTKDSLIKLEIKAEENISVLKNRYHEREDQLSYLMEEKKRYLSNRDQVLKINKQLASLSSENTNTKAYIDEYEQLLSRLRCLDYKSKKNQIKEIQEIQKLFKTLENNNLEIDQSKISPFPKILEEAKEPFQTEYNCILEKNREDNLLSTKYETFFSYTDPKIESFFIDQDFVNCQVRIIKAQKVIYLELKLKFGSARAAKIYGSLNPNNPIKLMFQNDDFIYLRPNNVVEGKIEEKTGHTIYKIQIPLDREKQKKIRNSELDKIVFLFDTGIESFDLFHFDLIKNMLECIKKN
jgi:hypothetical protein